MAIYANENGSIKTLAGDFSGIEGIDLLYNNNDVYNLVEDIIELPVPFNRYKIIILALPRHDVYGAIENIIDGTGYLYMGSYLTVYKGSIRIGREGAVSITPQNGAEDSRYLSIKYGSDGHTHFSAYVIGIR